MTSGGVRARPGPAPDPLALRRDKDKADWIHLPADGRQEPAPSWPLVRATKREQELWERAWRRPQAIMWERNGQEYEVALYLRTFGEAEVRGATAALRTLVRQQEEALGLSLPGLARNRWIIDAAEDDTPQRRPTPISTRDRLRSLDGAG